MTQQALVIVAPSYLSLETLPYASDIFYHGRIVYFGPTGIHPDEWDAVARFPAYCESERIALPQIVWQMCKGYFECSRLAAEAADILSPLQQDHVSLVLTVYDRDVEAVRRAKATLRKHPDLVGLFGCAEAEIPFLSREFMSHLFCDLYMRDGYEGVVDYLGNEADSSDHFVELLVAVLLNRFRLFTGHESSLLLYEGSWYPFLMAVCGVQQGSMTPEAQGAGDAESVEFMCYKLFETILLPVFGRVDTKKKAEIVAQTASDHNAEITELKAVCRKIARNVATSATSDLSLKDELLRDAVQHGIEEPLAALLRKPREDASRLLREVLLDSGFIATVLGAMQGFDSATLGTAVAAGTLSAGFRYLISERSQNKAQASSLLVGGMKKAGLAERDMRKHLRDIGMKDLELPDWLRELASREASGGGGHAAT